METDQALKVKIVTLYDPQKQKQDKYMLSLKIVGEGKYGKVYKAVHVDKPEVLFAVKVIKLESQKIRKQCLKQLQIIKQLPKCMNLVKIHPQHLQSSNNFYIFEEYCDGGTLYDEKLQRKNNPFTQDQVFNIFYQVVSGFIQLRKAGIFHQDMKPHNILKKNNIYKITDFGISQLDGPKESSTIRKGTLVYMPPQKLKNAYYVPTSKSQIFSLGVTLYQVFFGNLPYVAKKPKDYTDYLKMITNCKLKSVDQLKNHFRNSSLRLDKLIRMILRMIQLNQSKRLSLDELTNYIKTAQPFISMKIIENYDGVNKKQIFSDKKKYEIIQQSKILYAGSTNGQSISKAFKVKEEQDYYATLETLKIYLEFFRKCSVYLQQGVMYLCQTNLYSLKQPYKFKQNVFKTKYQYIQFLVYFYMDYIFSEIDHKMTDIIMNIPISEEQITDFQIQIAKDSEFIKNQFLKIFTELELPQKKLALEEKKDEAKNVGKQIENLFKNVYEDISCIRINFKEEILTTIFLKSVRKVLQYILTTIFLFQKDSSIKQISNHLDNPLYQQCNKIMSNFCKYEALRRDKLENIVHQQMKGEHQIIYDDQSNSDEFEVLQLDDQ